ncbi:unnamed protein product [Paramecium pentaurelia]|uniref:Amino acid transporter transmembrane domain-containing protein n=1 Tax=Paramecium pentaurelia TaxID=43138 RepID=A0A8S1WMK0_9CILI|nr:unnamed protein product [Paramecium pentaurelia]
MSQVYESVNNQNQDAEKNFDQVYMHEKPYTGKAPVKGTYKDSAMTLIKGYVGSGILAMPFSFYVGGWLLSIFIFLISAYMLLLCVHYLIEVANAENKENQGLTEVAEVTYGEKGKQITKVVLIAYQLGKAVAYLIFFISFFAHIFSNADSQSGAGNWIYLIMAFCIVLPLSFIDNMARFAKLSLFANALILVGLVYITFYDFYQILEGDGIKENVMNLAHFEQFPMIIGVTAYGFGVLPLAFAIRVTMSEPNKFKNLFNVVSYFNLGLFLAFTLLSVWGMGSRMKSQQIILFCLDNNPLSYVIQICYAFGLICSYPLQVLPAFQQIERIEKLKSYINPELKYSSFRRLAIRSLINILLGLIGYSIPKFAYFVNILGAIGGASLNFLFPILIHKKYFENDELKRKSKFTYYGILSFGICGGLCSFIYTIVKLTSH